MVSDRIEAFRKLMIERGIDAYVIPTADFHESEYAGEYFKCRAFMSGFTGSAGTLVITEKIAGLWTDGRYFIQAKDQLKGSGITLYRMGEDGVPGIYDFLLEQVPEEGCIGFDGRVINAKLGEAFEEIAEIKGGKVLYEEDLVDAVWADRPELSHEPIYLLDKEVTGESRIERIKRLREAVKEHEAEVHIVTTLDDIAWLLNIRGNDVLYNPVALAYLVLASDECVLFVQSAAVSADVKNALEADGIELMEYEQFYDYVKTIEGDVLLDYNKVSYALIQNLNDKVEIIDEQNPTILMKAVKTKTEIDGMREAHIRDGLAVTRFMHWLKTNIGKATITEISAAEQLEEFRKEQAGYMMPSFETISAYGSNGAIVHYSPSEETNKTLEGRGFLLVDSGGQYACGTTDITRTFVLGELTGEQKLHYTAVLKGMLALADTRFKYGCTGLNLDYTARKYLWDLGLDYNHGTGHGVGFVLNVHEAPNSFRWRKTVTDSAVLEPGMITSDEPGLYLAGEYGIRTENLILCIEDKSTDYGRFLKFEHLTMVPIDLDGIDISSMEKVDIDRLNRYHELVYKTLSPHMSEEECVWLKEYTRAI